MRTFLSFREIDYYSKSFLSTKQDAVIKLINGGSWKTICLRCRCTSQH